MRPGENTRAIRNGDAGGSIGKVTIKEDVQLTVNAIRECHRHAPACFVASSPVSVQNVRWQAGTRNIVYKISHLCDSG